MALITAVTGPAVLLRARAERRLLVFLVPGGRALLLDAGRAAGPVVPSSSRREPTSHLSDVAARSPATQPAERAMALDAAARARPRAAAGFVERIADLTA